MDAAPSKTTIADLARAVGVSKATVSYALNGRKGVSPDTRQRVLESARTMGYEVRRRSSSPVVIPGAIGAVLSPTPGDQGPNYYVAELLIAAERHCRERGYTLVVTSEEQAVGRANDGPNVQGLLYLGGSLAPEVGAAAGLPTVLVGAASTSWACDSVLADNQQAAFLATTHLLSLGRRSLALINGPDRTPTSQNKLTGFREALAAAGVDADRCPVVQGDFSSLSGQQLATTLLSAPEPPDGIFVADDPMGLGVLHAIADLGLTSPDDVAVIGLGGSHAGKASRPTLSTVGVFQEDLGRLGAKLLIERIEGDTSPVQRILLRPELVLRGSTQVQAAARTPAPARAQLTDVEGCMST